MNLQNASSRQRPDSEPLDWKEYCEGHDYPYVNILGPSANKSRRRINWFNWFAGVTLALAIAAAILEAQ